VFDRDLLPFFTIQASSPFRRETKDMPPVTKVRNGNELTARRIRAAARKPLSITQAELVLHSLSAPARQPSSTAMEALRLYNRVVVSAPSVSRR
jgi:hypothetical protein